jgi:hypothetical protein
MLICSDYLIVYLFVGMTSLLTYKKLNFHHKEVGLSYYSVGNNTPQR